jgi:endonuclease/exonuclease/phosphatase family metal-dependent hydrolase
LDVLKNIEDGPLIFAGDLNSKEGSEIVCLLEQSLSNALRGSDLRTFANHPFSFQGFEVNDLEYLLDYIFVNDQVRVLAVHAENVAGSDHLPVVAMMELGL